MRLMNQRGDTIVEVLFAVTIFALVAVGSLLIMNQGISSAQRSLEITLVRQQIDAQAEAIRYIHKAYVAAFQSGAPTPTGTAAEWTKMTSKVTGKGANTPSVFGAPPGGRCPTTAPGERPFLLNARTATMLSSTPSTSSPTGGSVPPYAQVIYNPDSSINATYGLWIEAIPSSGTDGPGFVDFHIRACWESAGNDIPSTLGTIVRLYEPR